ncbi:MAG: hypothetical protein WKF84_25965 [Pyrinomonadaceae bacterium]
MLSGSTRAALEAVNSFPRRLFASVLCLAAVSTLLLFWGLSGRGAEQRESIRSGQQTNALTQKDQVTLSVETARKIVSSLTADSVKDVRLTRTAKGQVIIADCENAETGLHRVYAIERRGEQFKLSAQAPLDTLAFRGAAWFSELIDADGDGYGEVLYTGTSIEGEAVGGRRLMLYTARTRKFYILKIEPLTGDNGALRVVWSPNAMKPAAAPIPICARATSAFNHRLFVTQVFCQL